MANTKELTSSLRLFEAGKATLNDVRRVFETLDNFHDFSHYLSDEDIRLQDPEYREMQEAELDKFLEALEAGDDKKANGITFLSNTGTRSK